VLSAYFNKNQSLLKDIEAMLGDAKYVLIILKAGYKFRIPGSVVTETSEVIIQLTVISRVLVCPL
jgi:hypothetical protein